MRVNYANNYANSSQANSAYPIALEKFMNTVPYLAISNRLRSTPFTNRVRQQGATAFTVYNHMLLPTEFESVENDYWHLCEHVQVWDVGAERQVEIVGPDAQKLVQWMTPRDLSQVTNGRCVYTPLADEQGLLINDPIALKLAENHWWLSIADSDVLLWAKGLATAAALDVSVKEPDVWPIAVQGPKAEELMSRVFGNTVKDIRFFRFQPMPFNGRKFNVARSGWSKQGGFEIYVDSAQVGVQLYDALFAAGADLQVRPGCPNLIERMESSLLSFGNDMTLQHSVLECGLDAFFDIETRVNSLAGDALRKQKANGLDRKLFGLALLAPKGAKPVAVNPINGHLSNQAGESVGRMGSQVWSPRFQHQLVTVMLEKAYFVENSGKQAIELLLENGSHEKATILPLPFNFSDAGIN